MRKDVYNPFDGRAKEDFRRALSEAVERDVAACHIEKALQQAGVKLLDKSEGPN